MIDANDPVAIMQEFVQYGLIEEENRRRITQPERGYRPQYCQEVIDFCAGGYSLASFAGHINVSQRTLNNWMNRYPEFGEAVHVARAKAVLHHDKNGVKIAEEGGEPGQVQVTKFYLTAFGREEFLPASQPPPAAALVGGIGPSTSAEEAMRIFEAVLRGGTARISGPRGGGE
jgi:hypothetical protein